jgi:hypothetical protein
MDTIELFRSLVVSLAIGLPIGLERSSKARAEHESVRAAGLRTNALSRLLGGVWGGSVRGLGRGQMAPAINSGAAVLEGGGQPGMSRLYG